MEREIYKVVDEAEDVTVMVRLKLSKDEYAQYRSSFLNEFQQLEGQIKQQKEELVKIAEIKDPVLDGPLTLELIEKAIGKITRNGREDTLRESIKQNEKIFEKSRLNCKNLKALE